MLRVCLILALVCLSIAAYAAPCPSDLYNAAQICFDPTGTGLSSSTGNVDAAIREVAAGAGGGGGGGATSESGLEGALLDVGNVLTEQDFGPTIGQCPVSTGPNEFTFQDVIQPFEIDTVTELNQNMTGAVPSLVYTNDNTAASPNEAGRLDIFGRGGITTTAFDTIVFIDPADTAVEINAPLVGDKLPTRGTLTPGVCVESTTGGKLVDAASGLACGAGGGGGDLTTHQIEELQDVTATSGTATTIVTAVGPFIDGTCGVWNGNNLTSVTCPEGGADGLGAGVDMIHELNGQLINGALIGSIAGNTGTVVVPETGLINIVGVSGIATDVISDTYLRIDGSALAQAADLPDLDLDDDGSETPLHEVAFTNAPFCSEPTANKLLCDFAGVGADGLGAGVDTVLEFNNALTDNVIGSIESDAGTILVPESGLMHIVGIGGIATDVIDSSHLRIDGSALASESEMIDYHVETDDPISGTDPCVKEGEGWLNTTIDQEWVCVNATIDIWIPRAGAAFLLDSDITLAYLESLTGEDIFSGSDSRSFPYTHESLEVNDDNVIFFTPHDAVTLTGFWCVYDSPSALTTAPTIHLSDGEGNMVTSADATCANGRSATRPTVQLITAANAIGALESVAFHTIVAPVPNFPKITLHVEFTE